MSRKKKKFLRKITLDYKFNNLEISKFINLLMISGKKSIAENILYKALDYIKFKIKKNPLKIFSDAVNNCKPLIEIKYKKLGNSSYRIPTEVCLKRRLTLSLKWLRESAINRKGKYMFLKLANELIDASLKRGNAYKKREDTHKFAEKNKNFTYFRFF